jgi:hypothetical protein
MEGVSGRPWALLSMLIRDNDRQGEGENKKTTQDPCLPPLSLSPLSVGWWMATPFLRGGSVSAASLGLSEEGVPSLEEARAALEAAAEARAASEGKDTGIVVVSGCCSILLWPALGLGT